MAAAIVTTATTLEGQALEVLRELQILEAAGTINRVVITVNSESEFIAITANIPIELGGSGGELTFAATEYV